MRPMTTWDTGSKLAFDVGLMRLPHARVKPKGFITRSGGCMVDQEAVNTVATSYRLNGYSHVSDAV